MISGMEIKVHVKPNAPENKIISRGDVWKIAIAAPAEKGKANRELIKFLQEVLKCKVEIVRGLASRRKVLLLY